MENNGIKRSLTLSITKFINGIVALNYPKFYRGMTASSTWTGWTGTVYPSITEVQLKELSTTDYGKRLADLKLWVDSQEGIGITAQAIITPPELTDIVECPLPQSTCMITVTSENILLGTVTGGGALPINSQCSIQATPNIGKTFSHWEVNGGSSSNISNRIYTFTVLAPMTFVAHFTEIIETTYSIAYTNHVCQLVP